MSKRDLHGFSRRKPNSPPAVEPAYRAPAKREPGEHARKTKCGPSDKWSQKRARAGEIARARPERRPAEEERKAHDDKKSEQRADAAKKGRTVRAARVHDRRCRPCEKDEADD